MPQYKLVHPARATRRRPAIPERYDAIILGGGHNGLTCGAYLARAGLRTIVARAAARDRRRSRHRRDHSGLQVQRIQLPDEPPPSQGDRGPRACAATASRSCRRPTCSVRSTPATTSCSATRSRRRNGASRAFRRRTQRLSGVRSLPHGIGGDPAQDPARNAARSVVPRLEIVQADGGVPVEVPPRPRQALPDGRSLHDERRRLPLRVVREHPREGGARLLLRNRHFCRAKEPGLGLRCHASPHGRARRSGRLGIHSRRHGHDLTVDCRVRPGQGPGDSHERRSDRDRRRRRQGHRRDARRWHARRGADRREQRQRED